jgi:hypothetical protein
MECDYHSHQGEATIGSWAMEKLSYYLFSAEFTWLTDSIGLQKFMELSNLLTHALQHVRMQLLQFIFTISHHLNYMLMDVDALTHYNAWTTKWRETPGDITCEIPFDMMTNESLETTPLNDKTTLVTTTQDDPCLTFDDSTTTSVSFTLMILSSNLPLSSSVICGFSVVPITTVGSSLAP